jgi:hypothetical protein
MYTDIDIEADTALERIRELNDETRRYLPDGRIVISCGIASLAAEDQAAILEGVRTFDEFSSQDDPYGEHDFGAFERAGHRVFWKIDYYDRDGEDYGSPDPSDPSKTHRVLTIMLAGEY